MSNSEFPNIIKPIIGMSKPNNKFSIIKGLFKLSSKERGYNIKGEVYFSWFPNIVVKFKGKVKGSYQFLLHEYQVANSFTLTLPDNSQFDVILTYFNTNFKDSNLAGVARSNVILGDKSIKVEKVHFEVPNFKWLFGDAVNDSGKLSNNRIHLNDSIFEINIDSNSNYNKLGRLLRDTGGYMVLHSGELKKIKGPISFDESNKILYKLNRFLSFINGGRTSPFFRTGLVESEVVWKDYSQFAIEPFKELTSWSGHLLKIDYSALWKEFTRLYDDKSSEECFSSSLHWYLEANKNAGYAEGSIIMIQAGLELLYNWIIVEKKNIIIGEDADKISASNKIRLLISQINIESNIPNSLQNLTRFAKDHNLTDAPGVFAEIRNSIVHSRKNKRDILKKADKFTRAEARNLGLWYIELLLLNTLGYTGKYLNRCNQKNELVPWAK
jgi:hypothetical protein